MLLRLTKFCKDFLLFFPITLILQPLGKGLEFIVHFNRLILWIYKNKRHLQFSDFYIPFRDYSRRKKLYAFLSDRFQLSQECITYLEFGVAEGSSFQWWLEKNSARESFFVGFDTFEGLPEAWGGFFQKGAMAAEVPKVNDPRARFIKGLFQDTLPEFIYVHREMLRSETRKVIHMDADLYSSTSFVLTHLRPYLRTGDLILFDEFSVAMHEFKAFMEFQAVSGVKMMPVASVNNFYQIAFLVKCLS